MHGILLGAAMLVSSSGALPPPQPVLTPAAFTLTLPDAATMTRWQRESTTRVPVARVQRHSKTDKIIAIAAGVGLGWIVGGAAGYYATQDRDRDDDGTSGLKGVIIGAPIGAAVGALIGWRLTRD